MVSIKCPYCGSVAIDKQLGEEEYSRVGCYQIWEGTCSECGEEFEINIDFELVPTEITCYSKGEDGVILSNERKGSYVGI